MNRKKMILGVAAILVIFWSSVAFRVTKFGTHKVAGFTLTHRQICKQCLTLWTHIVMGIHTAHCKSAGGGTLIQPGIEFTWATAGNEDCRPVMTRVTHTQ